MNIGKFYIVKSQAVKFHWTIHIIRRKDNLANNIYHWLWFTFGRKKR